MKGPADLPPVSWERKLDTRGGSDESAKNPPALLTDLDRACKRDRRPFAAGMCAQLEPVLVIGLACLAIPFLLGDDVAGFRRAPLPEFDVEARVFVPIDAHF